MSIVSKESLENIENLIQKGYEASSWESKYQWVIRAAEAAITLLKQIEHTTKNVHIETTITLRKE